MTDTPRDDRWRPVRYTAGRPRYTHLARRDRPHDIPGTAVWLGHGDYAWRDEITDDTGDLPPCRACHIGAVENDGWAARLETETAAWKDQP